MATQTYTCRRYKSVGPFEYSADFSQASSPIKIKFLGSDDFDWQSTPFQVADCSHDRRRCEEMLARHFK